MGVVFNPNRQFYGRFGECRNPDRSKWLGIFRRSCVLIGAPLNECSLQKEYPRPKIYRK